MAITAQSATLAQAGSIRLIYQSDEARPLYHVYRDGRLIRTTHRPETVLRIDGERTPVFRVTDAPTDAFAGENDGRALVAWARSPGASHYRIEEYVDPDWIERATLPDLAAGRLSWLSGQLSDDAVAQFRVVAVGFAGIETVATSVALLIQRTPDPPLFTAAVNTLDGLLELTTF